MSAIILNGKEVASQWEKKNILRVQNLKTKGVSVCLAVARFNDDEASKVYVKKKVAMCEKLGIKPILIEEEGLDQERIENRVSSLNKDKEINGIIVQLPLPKGIDKERVLSLVSPEKDVDGLNVFSCGLLYKNMPGLRPCTPSGIIRLLKEYKIELIGKRAVILGRSQLVGLPIFLMLLHENATPTIVHSKTMDLKNICKEADILIVATGKAKMVNREYVKKGAVVVDVGISRVDGKIVGDVDFDDVFDVAGYLTPVPGGVGPLTIMSLMENVINAASIQAGIKDDVV
ncbi:methylenetetrahydrofolate dehydrogenase (NADP+) / methenyltetrahydrofolate cyclohydrolase [Thermodesulfobium acidiphilum]|uniref:Bifunctional protein FolD n=1 Tax=Thermodesulfobium acidiphilum TaxID=1794699 RepID=A0A2R4VZP9_THEAF|nr:bifunctional 5,10-methylenetetrahydrofolate dehydrogenase/5,10-methenyltetrahydrofolate cyclohydrolase [Thermodesulfobium acidiphilum]AWB09956.1 methylenetetrahydrofolate dehydrogenase (NADP+) / methenyltetrahydrofolate cyclohydrolase [Thermodesulfobium acidiphilum]PMP86969.1 MAG: bifunctional 5,10-methylene-tetrahydrofolate dehydrogenase/5,10-methylene-tetrahydrofolate cyclohydrolase [Thermodesulfobium narugense]